jgi:hypothetical protein
LDNVPIGFSLKGNAFDGVVTDPATHKDLVRLSGNAEVGVPGPRLDLVLYSRNNGNMLRTLVNTRGGAKTGATMAKCSGRWGLWPFDSFT